MNKKMNKEMDKEMDKEMMHVKQTHAVWNKFYNWVVKSFGEDLYGEWLFMEVPQKNGKTKKLKYRNFNEFELSKRLVGYKVMQKIEKYANKNLEIKIVRCDDSLYASSFLVLIPHPKHGITIMFIPQLTGIQNQFFLYEGHFKQLTKALSEMKNIYN